MGALCRYHAKYVIGKFPTVCSKTILSLLFYMLLSFLNDIFLILNRCLVYFLVSNLLIKLDRISTVSGKIKACVSKRKITACVAKSMHVM